MWFLLALANAFFESLSDAASKKGAQAVDPWLAAPLLRLIMTVILLPLALILEPVPKFSYDFLGLVILCWCIMVVTTLLYLHAIRTAPLSLGLPILKLSPAFVLISSPILTGDIPSRLGIFGVLFMVAGTYWVNLDRRIAGIWEPLFSIWKVKELRLLLILAIVWGVVAPLDRIGINFSSPFWWLVIVNLGTGLFLLPLAKRFAQRPELSLWQRVKFMSPAGLAHATSVAFQMHAIQLAPVHYVISIKRLSVLFGLIWAKVIFHEERVSARLPGVLLIIAGTLMILFA